MQNRTLARSLVALTLILSPGLAQAYIGPGVGAGAIGTVIAFFGAILMAIFAVVWYPIKRLLKGKKKPASSTKPKTKTE